MARIFVSHSSKDKPFVHELKKWLGREGHDAWVDEHEIRVGERVQRKIEDNIGRCDAVLFVLSPDAVDSRWVQEELRIAVEKRSRLLPLLLKDCGERFPVALQEIKYADFRDSRKKGWQELAQTLSRWNPSLEIPSEGPASQDKPRLVVQAPVARIPATSKTPASPRLVMAALVMVIGGMGLTLTSDRSSAQSPGAQRDRRKSLLLQLVEGVRGPESSGPNAPSPAIPVATPVKSNRLRAPGDGARSLAALRGQDGVRPLQDNESNVSVDRLPMGSFGFVELDALRFLRNAQTSLTDSSTSFEVHKTPEGELLLIGYTSEPAFAGAGTNQPLSLSLAPKQNAWARRLIRIPLNRINGISTRFDQGQAIADLHLGASVSGR